MISFSNLKGYVFDLDGTLLDNDDAHLKAWLIALKGFVRGANVDVSDVVQCHFGKSSIDIALLFLGDIGRAEKCVELKERIYESLWPKEARVMPCAKELLEFLKEKGLRIGVASSNSREKIIHILDYFNLLEMIDVITGLDDVGEGKPSPDLLLKNLKKLEVKPSESVYVGDSPYDVLMARRAGASSILVKTYKRVSIEETGVWPDVTVNSLCELYNLLAELI